MIRTMTRRDSLGFMTPYRTVTGAGVNFTKGNLLLNFNGDCADSSGTGKSVSIVGADGYEYDTSVKKYGSASLKTGYGENGERYASVGYHPDFDVAASDFTLRMWINPDVENQYSRAGLWFCAADTGFGVEYNIGQTNGIGLWATSGSGWNMISSDGEQGWSNGTFTEGAWGHLEVGRSGSNWYIFINGTLDKTIADVSGTVVSYTGARHIGRAINRGMFFGHIDGLQLIKGRCLHTSSFTPETAEL